MSVSTTTRSAPSTQLRASLRSAYARLLTTLRDERTMRERVFQPSNPRRTKKLAEMDTALTDLRTLGDALAAVLGEAEAEPAQAALPGMPEARRKEYA